MGMGSIVWLGVLVLGLQVSLSACSGAPTDVVVLDDATFEHQTQASTGQTTGSWCVLFTASRSSDVHKESVQLWSELAADEEKEVIYAMVDLDANKQLARRFKGIRVPSAVLLRDRAMYTYDIPNDDDSAEVIIGFVSGGYTQLPRQVVPSPSSGLLDASESDGDSASLTDSEVWRLIVAGVLVAVALVWKLALYLNGPKLPAGTAAPQEGRPEPVSAKKAAGKAERDEKKAVEPPADKDKEKAAGAKPEGKKKADAAVAKASEKPSKANASEAGAKKKAAK